MLRAAYADIEGHSRALAPRQRLRPYQLEPARAIVESVRCGGGGQFAVVFSRQSGKDELLAQTIAYLLGLYRLRGGSIVVASPTLRPQGMITRARVAARLDTPVTRGLVGGSAHVLEVGRARCAFVSTAPSANARGETASLLLVCNEAQDVLPERWDAVYDPMAASTNATTLFMGTVWTGRTLLARQMRYLEGLEREDGIRRVYKAPWETVAREVPAYGERVRARIKQLGRQHPFVKTEYFLEELGGEGGLFPRAVRDRMRGSHAAREAPEAGKTYALLIDVGGEERDGGKGERERAKGAGGLDLLEEALQPGARRDATALTVVEVDTSSVADPVLLAPTYRVVHRRAWTGAGQPELLRELARLAGPVWGARKVVVDATGVGAGLAAFLERALGPRVVSPFVFTQSSKSELGWEFLSLCSSGRFQDHAPDGSAEQGLFWAQVEECEYETLPGPGRKMRWGVEGRTHDDLLVSAAFCAVLDGMEWKGRVARGRAREEAD